MTKEKLPRYPSELIRDMRKLARDLEKAGY